MYPWCSPWSRPQGLQGRLALTATLLRMPAPNRDGTPRPGGARGRSSRPVRPQPGDRRQGEERAAGGASRSGGTSRSAGSSKSAWSSKTKSAWSSKTKSAWSSKTKSTARASGLQGRAKAPAKSPAVARERGPEAPRSWGSVARRGANVLSEDHTSEENRLAMRASAQRSVRRRDDAMRRTGNEKGPKSLVERGLHSRRGELRASELVDYPGTQPENRPRGAQPEPTRREQAQCEQAQCEQAERKQARRQVRRRPTACFAACGTRSCPSFQLMWKRSFRAHRSKAGPAVTGKGDRRGVWRQQQPLTSATGTRTPHG